MNVFLVLYRVSDKSIPLACAQHQGGRWGVLVVKIGSFLVRESLMLFLYGCLKVLVEGMRFLDAKFLFL